MPVLSTSELQKVRNECAETIPVNYTKPEINAISQAIEDWLVSQSAEVQAVIDAIKPGITNAQKKKMVAEVLFAKFLRDR